MRDGIVVPRLGSQHEAEARLQSLDASVLMEGCLSRHMCAKLPGVKLTLGKRDGFDNKSACWIDIYVAEKPYSFRPYAISQRRAKSLGK